MAKHYFVLGMGGTGSKCLESFTHLAAAGMAPPQVWIGLVDQDRSNGNLSRTTRILDLYKKGIKGALGAMDGGFSGSLFKTDFQFPPDDLVWVPMTEKRNLRELFRYNLLKPEARDILEALFSDPVLDMNLEKGFMGQPNAGAAVLSSIALGGAEFWQELMEKLDAIQSGDEVYVFMISSIFGGTGAAAFPTMTKLINRRIEDKKLKRESVKIGGALMLPYFRYPPPKDDEDVINFSEQFLSNTQIALHHYLPLISPKRLLDAVYLIGWDPMIFLNYSSLGGPEQTNPPLMPELYAAAAAITFFNSDKSGVVQIGRANNKPLDWNDLPHLEDYGVGSLHSELGSMIRYAFAYLTGYHQWLKSKDWRKVKNQVWFKRLLRSQGIAMESEEVQRFFDSMAEYCRYLLQWAASIAYFNEGEPFDLYNADAFAKYVDTQQEHEVEIREPSAFERNGFSHLVAPEESVPLYEVFRRLSRYKTDEIPARKMGKFCSALYRACRMN
jgi:hypothetical protein